MLSVLRVVKRLASLVVVLIAIAVVATTSVLAIAPQVTAIAASTDSSAAELELETLDERSQVFAADGTFLSVLTSEENREAIPLDDVPQVVIDAILAIEDSDFYSHNGVNLRGTARALIENVNAGGIEQGGSTITQQLVKLSILSSDQNFDRKSLEAFYAVRLEEQMSKDEILERYLNTVYFGSGAYGVKAAVETYWGYEDLDRVGWAEAALLAGIIRSPSGYDPTNFPEIARERRSVVLNRLASTGAITQDEADGYKLAPLPAERQEPISIKPRDYFVEEVLQILLQKDPTILGGDVQDRIQAVYRGGLQIYTTFDPRLQELAEAARDNILPQTERGYTVAIATVDSKTGAVRALVGGPEFETAKFNLATQANRQPGSTMKTFVLAALFEAGYSPNDVVRADGPCRFPDTTSRSGFYQVGGRFLPRQSIAAVTRSSNNCAFVRLGQVAGSDKVTQVTRRLGIELSPNAPFLLSLPLGVEDVKVLEMASAYAAFANDGRHNRPWLIERIEDSEGNLVYQRSEDWTRAVSQNTARQVTEVLASNVTGGTGTSARLTESGHVAAGKTGTTQSFKDAWFVGYTEYYSTAVWLGDPNPVPEPIRIPGWNSFGGGLPATIWGAYMDAVHVGLEPRAFPPADRVAGGRYLQVVGEIDYCDDADFQGRSVGTELIDSNGDGIRDCYRPIPESTTTTTVDPLAATTFPPDQAFPTLPTFPVPQPTFPAPQPTFPPATGVGEVFPPAGG